MRSALPNANINKSQKVDARTLKTQFLIDEALPIFAP
jgi:hypothetical protein